MIEQFKDALGITTNDWHTHGEERHDYSWHFHDIAFMNNDDSFRTGTLMVACHRHLIIAGVLGNRTQRWHINDGHSNVKYIRVPYYYKLQLVFHDEELM